MALDVFVSFPVVIEVHYDETGNAAIHRAVILGNYSIEQIVLPEF